MNTYRVAFKIGNRKRRYDVDATHPSAAIHHALNGFSRYTTPDIDVSVRLFARNIDRHYSDPKVRAV